MNKLQSLQNQVEQLTDMNELLESKLHEANCQSEHNEKLITILETHIQSLQELVQALYSRYGIEGSKPSRPPSHLRIVK